MSASPIYILTHEFYPRRGGIATVTEEIARASALLGCEVEVWAQALPRGEVEKPWPFRVRRLALKGTHNFLCLLELARELIRHRRQLRYATVYLSEPGPMLTLMSLQFLKAFRPTRLILTFHGSEILKFHRHPLKRWLTRRLIRNAARVSTLTHYTQELLCTHFPEAAPKIFLTPGALRADFTAPAAPAARRPAAVTRPADKIVVLTVGRLHPRKGQLQTLQALQGLPAAQRARLEYWLVAGESKGNYEQTLQAAAAQADFPVKFLGNVPDDQLEAIYAQADIFAMTSINHGLSVEGFGLVYLEASAHGLPIVAHAVGGVSEAVAHNVTGLLVPPDAPVELTAAFARLMDDAALRQQLGDAGREWARRNCWEQSARVLFDLPPPAPSP